MIAVREQECCLMRGIYKCANVRTHARTLQITYMNARACNETSGLRVIPVPLMEISRNVRCGFLRWHNERGHRDLNIAVDLLLPLSPPFLRANAGAAKLSCRRIWISPFAANDSPLIIPPSCKHGFNQIARKLSTLQVLHALPSLEGQSNAFLRARLRGNGIAGLSSLK